jgi:pyruvate dehydrogenase E2 component (dihydrolipoamide acetyltransferase)
MAVAVDEGLVVPVIKFADQKSLRNLSTEAKALAQKAVAKKLSPAEMDGSTFTISNLGMFGIESFTAIINQPNACILAVGAIQQEPVVKDGKIEVGHIMKVSLSSDHRVVDGAVGSKFLISLKKYLESPLLMLI